MPKFTGLDNGILEFGNNETYNQENEIAFILELNKQINLMNPQDPNHVMAFKKNANEISKILGLNQLPVTEAWDDATNNTYRYLSDNINLFKKHGITEHVTAKKLEKTTNPAFTETESAPTIDEMKSLEVDIGKLYNEA